MKSDLKLAFATALCLVSTGALAADDLYVPKPVELPALPYTLSFASPTVSVKVDGKVRTAAFSLFNATSVEPHLGYARLSGANGTTPELSSFPPKGGAVLLRIAPISYSKARRHRVACRIINSSKLHFSTEFQKTGLPTITGQQQVLSAENGNTFIYDFDTANEPYSTFVRFSSVAGTGPWIFQGCTVSTRPV